MSGDDIDEIYSSIVADIAKLARKLAKTESNEEVNGHIALLSFADHLEGIVAAVGVRPSKVEFDHSGSYPAAVIPL